MRRRTHAPATTLMLVTVLAAGCKVPGTEPREIQSTIPSGTEVHAVLQSAVSTRTSAVGDRVVLQVADGVRLADGVLVVPAGAQIRGTVTHVAGAGRIRGAPELTLRFRELVLPDGKHEAIQCAPFRVVGKGDGRESAAQIGGGAAVGGILGGVLGGKDDVVPGAAIGAVLGTGVAVATKGDAIVLPAGLKIRVTIAAPVLISVPASAA